MAKKNYLILAVVFGLALAYSVRAASTGRGGNAVQADSDVPGWKIDKALKFQIAYVPDKNVARNGEKPKPMLKNKAAYAPDIDNIILANIKALGFNLPDRTPADQYKLYLKLFNFPDSLEPQETAYPLLRKFKLDKTVGGAIFEDFISQKDNLAVKYAYIDKADRQFSQDKPFPRVVIPGNAQSFNKYVTFCSLYVKSSAGSKSAKSDDDKAKASTGCVVAFHQELLEAYGKSLKLLKAPSDSDKNFYFCADGDKCSKVLKVPQEPIIINDWRNAPMPTSDKDFLSGLLLIYYMDNSSGGMTPKIVFEVGSLMRMQ